MREVEVREEGTRGPNGEDPRGTQDRDSRPRWDERISGWALIVGGALLFVVMTHHPEPAGATTEDLLEQVRGMAGLARWVHAGALLAVALVTFGFLGLARSLARGSVLVRASTFMLIVGSATGSGAGLLNGFLSPELAERLAGAGATEIAAARPVLAASAELAHLLATLHVVGWSSALLLLGVEFLLCRARRGSWRVWLGALGLLCGIAPLVSIALGWLDLDVLGFTLFVASQVIWFVGAGVALLRRRV